MALGILEQLAAYNQTQSDRQRKFDIRIGINQNTDNLIVDINSRTNVSGSGITIAQRVMNFSEASTITVGRSVYERLSQRQLYMEKFNKYSVEIKHNVPLDFYQYIDAGKKFLNTNTLSPFVKPLKTEPKFSKLAAYLIANLIKYKEFVILKSAPGGSRHVLFVIMAFLAQDCVGQDSSSPYSPYKPHLPGSSLEDNFEIINKCPFYVYFDLGTS